MRLNLKLLIALMLMLFLVGCSFLVYTPVVVSAALGTNKTDLSSEVEYKSYIGREFLLEPLNGVAWQLKKFDGGRYHVELASDLGRKEVICNLDQGVLVIDEIFDDNINGGVFYSGVATCNSLSHEVPLNSWSESVRSSLKPVLNGK